ncbi:hypothetical protein [Candidatus Formimonas warabiya]|uniref:Uncharacterized protein n=1 Tax=Formimonas warabiya TaxID=1761012 RepID=A0A3G1KP80_FORW1|nr:hypothetical protein [Candidatus Formimonas warabiya]ATW24258.1 hypothetical protein DCMF_05175 [Candidatus Formimonas warabiya]
MMVKRDIFYLYPNTISLARYRILVRIEEEILDSVFGKHKCFIFDSFNLGLLCGLRNALNAIDDFSDSREYRVVSQMIYCINHEHYDLVWWLLSDFVPGYDPSKGGC